MSESWVRTAGQIPYKLNLLVDESQLFEREENGRIVQYYKGANGAKVITDLGRDVSDLERAMSLVKAVDYSKGEKEATPRNREKLVMDTVTLSETVTKPLQTVTLDKTVTRNCNICGTDISNRRPQVKTCSDACRMKASRI